MNNKEVELPGVEPGFPGLDSLIDHIDFEDDNHTTPYKYSGIEYPIDCTDYIDEFKFVTSAFWKAWIRTLSYARVRDCPLSVN